MISAIRSTAFFRDPSDFSISFDLLEGLLLDAAGRPWEIVDPLRRTSSVSRPSGGVVEQVLGGS
jgi:hypothetical protein